MPTANTNRLKVTLPKRSIAYKVYRVTIGKHVYVGCTRDMAARSLCHIGTPGRAVYDTFHNTTHDMIVEYITGSDSYAKARQLEIKHIKLEHARVGNKILNVRHTGK